MKTITKFVANDGTEFTDPKDCAAYDELIRDVAALAGPLGPDPHDRRGCAFSNGDGYVWHNPQVVRRVGIALLRKASETCGATWKARFNELADKYDEAHPSHAARWMDEVAPKPLAKAWARIYCIDKQGREWGQPYYCMNPGQATQHCYEDRR